MGGLGGHSTYIWVGVCHPDHETPTLFMIKSLWKSWKIDTLFMIFSSNSTHFFIKMRDFQTLFIKDLRKFLNMRLCLWVDSRKTIPWRAAHLCRAYVWEYPLGWEDGEFSGILLASPNPYAVMDKNLVKFWYPVPHQRPYRYPVLQLTYKDID